MRRIRILVAPVCCLLLAGCTSDEPERNAQPPQPSLAPSQTPAPSPTQGRRVGTYEVAGDCDGFGRLREAQVTFAAGSELFVARSGGSVARCVFEVPEPVDLEWGAEGDRLHFGDLRRYDGRDLFSIDAAAESVAWSRPTGKSIVYIVDGALVKIDAFGSEPTDISFLERHDEVVYHPAGTHIAVTGTADDGTYGLWLATNVGRDAQLLAIGEDARRIFSLRLAHDGKTMYYAAEHDDHYDVHSLRLAIQDDEGRTRDAKLGTLDSAPTEMGDVVASEFEPDLVAYTVGSCEDKTTRVWNGSVVEIGGELAGLSTEPVGWLPDGELLVLARRDGCEGSGALYTWSPQQITRLVAGVGAAGVRAVLPPPPEPPGAEQQVVA